MNDAATAIVATGFFGSIMITVKAIAGVFRARAQARATSLPDAVANRLERIEAAVDAIAIEVERISEAQRYSLRLEEERARQLGAPRTPPPDSRVITPH